MHIHILSAKRLYTVTLVLLLLFAVVLSTVWTVPHAMQAMEDALCASAQAVLPQNIVILDAGHGGEDCGAIGASGVYEKDLNLLMTQALGEQLSKLGYTVLYTRTEDHLLYKEEENIKGFRKIYDLRNRCAFAAEYPQALFISLHMNTFGDARYHGLQVYYAPEGESSRSLAAAIQDAVVRDVQTDNHRVIKNGKDIYVLEHTENPAVLVECGFISNEEECAALSDAEYRARLASAIAQGIVTFSSSAQN